MMDTIASFRCDVSKQRKDGSVWTFKQPETVDKDGKTYGRGQSSVTAQMLPLSLKSTKHGTPGGGRAIAARLVGVRVDNLVPFNPETDFTDAEQARVEGPERTARTVVLNKRIQR